MMRLRLRKRVAETLELWNATEGVCGFVTRTRVSSFALSPRLAKLVFGERVAVRVDRLSSPIFLRPGTTDVLVFRQVFVEREYDADYDMPPTGLIVDAGANIGLTSIFFALRFPRCRIVALEPSPENFALLVQNTRRFTNITPVHTALWHESGTVEIRDPGQGAWGYRVGASPADDRSSEGTVPATSMRELVAQHGHIDLLKLDIEGAELNVLSDPASWIGSVSAIVAELHPAIHPECESVFDTATQGFEQELIGSDVRLARRPRATAARASSQ